MASVNENVQLMADLYQKLAGRKRFVSKVGRPKERTRGSIEERERPPSAQSRGLPRDREGRQSTQLSRFRRVSRTAGVGASRTVPAVQAERPLSVG